jgi:3-(3-hydroxy-phenyl)propionate hydroxylase
VNTGVRPGYDVAVVGFGPAGAVCAGLLGRLGLRTLVVDRLREVYDKPRAFALDHEILRVFQNLGVADAIAPYTAPFTPSEYYGVDGQLIKRLGSVPPPYPLGWPPNVVFSQPPAEEALRACVSAMPSVEVRLGVELTGLDQDRDGVTLALRDDSGTAHNARARYAVGCDGAWSTVRTLLGLPLDDLGFDEPWLVVDVQVNERGAAKLPAVSIQYCEPHRPATFLIGPGNHRRWEISLRPGEDRRAMEDEAEVWRLLSRWITPDDAALWRRASYQFHALVAREWRRGRVFIAGDAAHQQPPFTGQGMCQGVRDVANLAWKLHAVLSGRADETLLDTYEAERRRHVTRLTSIIKDIGAVICERDPEAARRRDARLLDEAGGEVRTVPRQHLIPPIETGCLSPVPHAANGTLFPQPRIRRDGATALLDDVAGTGFRVVLDARFDVAALARRDLLPALGARIVRLGAGGEPDVLAVEETEGVVAGWFRRHGCAAALVRPDHYVFGVATTAAELDAQLAAAAARLGKVKEHHA